MSPHPLAAAGDLAMMADLLEDYDQDEDRELRIAGHERARKLLKAHVGLIERIANALLAQHTLTPEEIAALL